MKDINYVFFTIHYYPIDDEPISPFILKNYFEMINDDYKWALIIKFSGELISGDSNLIGIAGNKKYELDIYEYLIDVMYSMRYLINGYTIVQNYNAF